VCYFGQWTRKSVTQRHIWGNYGTQKYEIIVASKLSAESFPHYFEDLIIEEDESN
jgi:hypothetical protein